MWGPQSVGGFSHGSERYTAPMVALSLRVLMPPQLSEQKDSSDFGGMGNGESLCANRTFSGSSDFGLFGFW